MGEEGKEKDEEFLFLDTLGDLAEVYLKRVYMWTYRERMPYHLAIHKVVADTTPHQSPGRYEFHAQQSIHRRTVSTKPPKKGKNLVRNLAKGP